MSKNTHIEKAAKYKSDPDYESWLRSQKTLTEPQKSSFTAFKDFVVEQREIRKEFKDRIRAPFRKKALQNN